MGADLARKRAGKRTRTGMSTKQLRDFASYMPAGGRMKGAWGDVGELRQKEARQVGGFKGARTISASKEFKRA